jgi:hypothetical protein
MAIPAQALLLNQPGNPAIVASQQNAWGGTDSNAPAFRGYVTFTLDGALTTATINWIDGSASIGYVPAGVRVSVVGGTQPAAAQIHVYPTAYTNATCTVTFSGAGTNANTLKLLVEIFKN